MVNIVDPANPMPKYLQIHDWLEEMILTGRYKSGEKLPTEADLAKMCLVNRNTLRQAVSELAVKGLVRKEKGVGVFVESRRPAPFKHKIHRISSFRDDLDEIGAKENTRVLKKGIAKPPRHAAQSLLLDSRSKVIVINRLRTGDKIPLLYEESYLPYEMFKNILNMQLTGSMYKILSERFNIVLARSRQSIRAVNLSKRIAKRFKLPPNAAGLYMESVTYDDNNVPVEVLCSYYRGDRYIFEVELGKYQITKEEIRSPNAK